MRAHNNWLPRFLKTAPVPHPLPRPPQILSEALETAKAKAGEDSQEAGEWEGL